MFWESWHSTPLFLLPICSGAYSLVIDAVRWSSNWSKTLSLFCLKGASEPLSMEFKLPPCSWANAGIFLFECFGKLLFLDLLRHHISCREFCVRLVDLVSEVAELAFFVYFAWPTLLEGTPGKQRIRISMLRPSGVHFLCLSTLECDPVEILEEVLWMISVSVWKGLGKFGTSA